MKNLKKYILTVAVLFVSTVAYALPIQNINEQKEINKETAIQAEQKNQELQQFAFDKFQQLSTRYITNINNCVPAHFYQYLDLFGFKLTLKFDINGWKDNKCAYFISGNIGGLGDDIREVFNLNLKDEVIAKFEPKAECNFDKSELKIITDMLEARNKQNTEIIAKLLDNTKDIEISDTQKKMTKEEEKFVKMITSSNACTILNKDELMQQFSSVMENL